MFFFGFSLLNVFHVYLSVVLFSFFSLIDIFYYIQLVQPAYQLMLEHIRSNTLDNFKKTLTDTLNGGQGFAIAARECTQKFTRLFDEQCQGIAINCHFLKNSFFFLDPQNVNFKCFYLICRCCYPTS